jgi:hypothetical protein
MATLTKPAGAETLALVEFMSSSGVLRSYLRIRTSGQCPAKNWPKGTEPRCEQPDTQLSMNSQFMRLGVPLYSGSHHLSSGIFIDKQEC